MSWTAGALLAATCCAALLGIACSGKLQALPGAGTPPFDAGSVTEAAVPAIDAGAPDTGPGEAGSMCRPGPVDTFTPVRIPAVSHPICSDAQVAAALSSCMSSTANKTACDAYLKDPGNNTCMNGCLLSAYANDNGLIVQFNGNPVPAASPPWGPLVTVFNPGATDFYNVGGCIALADPGQAACADAVNAQVQCEVVSCGGNCPAPDPWMAGVLYEWMDMSWCMTAADSTVCSAFAKVANACLQAIPESSPAAICKRLGSPNAAVAEQAFGPAAVLFCGGG